MIAQNAVELTDNYTDPGALELEQPGTVRITLEPTNAGFFYQLLREEDRSWSTDEVLATRSYSLERRCRGIRCRNAVAGQVCSLTVVLLTADEVP